VLRTLRGESPLNRRAMVRCETNTCTMAFIQSKAKDEWPEHLPEHVKGHPERICSPRLAYAARVRAGIETPVVS
jgi:hypothetical protein